LILPYPSEDMDHFHELAHQAKDLKTRLLGILGSLGPTGDPWINRIEHTVFYERYLPNDPSLCDARRPRASGLRAARELIEAFLQILTPASASGSSPSGCEETENSLVSLNAVEAVRSYMKAQSLTQQQFAQQCRTSARTLRNFMSTGKL